MTKAMRAPWNAIVDLFNGGVSKRFAFFAMVLGVVLLVGIALAFLVWPDVAVDDTGLNANERLQRENDARTTALQALAGIVLAVGGAFTAYSVLSTREGQLDERFARSLELMASKDAHVVSGAVFSLGRIAAQSKFDRAAVMDVLTGFVRAAPGEGDLQREVVDALQVIGRVNELPGSPRPDLRKTFWRRAQLQSLNLSGVFMSGSNFEGASLHRVKLRGAGLFQAKLARALILSVDLRKALLRNADLSDTLLISTNLSGADLTDADFSDADLKSARFNQKTILVGATYTEKTSFPKGFDPMARGMVKGETLLSTGDAEAG